jgi:predicted component of type VI protein secretion system
MSSERASVFDHGPDIDITGFKPRTAAKPAAQPEQVKAISETASFVSREPILAPRQTAAPAQVARASQAQMEPITREPRRHRTGRNTQLNIKARGEAIERFYAIADHKVWVLGETFERAIAALERELRSERLPSASSDLS